MKKKKAGRHTYIERGANTLTVTDTHRHSNDRHLP